MPTPVSPAVASLQKLLAAPSQPRGHSPVQADGANQSGGQTPRVTRTQDLRKPQVINRYSRFKLCEATIKVHQRGIKKETDNFYSTKNPYYSLKYDTEKRQRIKIYNDFVILNLLKCYLPKATIDKASIAIAFERTAQFIANNGANSFILARHLDRLKKMEEIGILLSDLQSKKFTASIYANYLNYNLDDNNQPIIKGAIPDTQKIPAESSGLRHSLFMATDENWYESLPYYELTNAHDNAIMKEFHSKVFAPKQQALPEAINSTIQKIIMGEGGTAKVIPALDLANNELVALKKYNKVNFCVSDYREFQKSIPLIPDHLKHHFILPMAYYLGPGKKSIITQTKTEKGKIIYPLSTANNGRDDLVQHLRLQERGLQEVYEDRCFTQALNFVEKTNVLEEMDVYFLDFKPANILGSQIIDHADMKKVQLPLQKVAHSRAYAMPHLFRKNITLEELKTSNRYNLGCMIFNQITGSTATSPQLDSLLSLPPDTEKNRATQMNDPAKGYALQGYPTENLSVVPNKMNSHSKRILTLFEKEMLKFAKQLMAEDRSKASAEHLNLNTRLEEIGRLRLSQTSH